MLGHSHQSTPRVEFALVGDCAQQLSSMRRWLKQAITLAYAWGIVGAATTQRLIDRLGLRSE